MIIRDENQYSLIWIHSTRQARRVRLLLVPLKSLLRPSRKYQLLELGAGQGLLSKVLAQEGFSVTAVERSHLLYRQYLKKSSEIHLQCYCQEALDFLKSHVGATYHAILGIGILHHIWHEKTWAEALYQTSSDDGVLIFLEPNPHNFIARWIFNTKWGRDTFKLDPDEKLKSIQDIRNELQIAGWKDIQITYQDLFYPFFPSHLRRLVEWAEPLLPPLLNQYLSQSILIVATKKRTSTRP